MKTFLFITLLVSFVECVFGRAVTIGYFALSPHSDKKNQSEILAFEYLKENEIFRNQKIKLQELPLPRLLTMLKHNEIDIALFLAKTPERESIGVFSKTPFHLMQETIAVEKNKYSQKIIDAATLKKMTIGVWGEGYINPIVLRNSGKLEPLIGQEVTARNLSKIISGKISGFYSPDHLTSLLALKKLDSEKKLKLIPISKKTTGLYLVFSKKFGTPTNLELYDRDLKKTLKQHSYEEFLLKKITFP